MAPCVAPLRSPPHAEQELRSFPIEMAAVLWDTAGFEGQEDRLYAHGELNYLLEGNLPNGTDLMTPITTASPIFNRTPSEADRMCALPHSHFLPPLLTKLRATTADSCWAIRLPLSSCL